MSRMTSIDVDSPEKTISDHDADIEEHPDTETYFLESNDLDTDTLKKKKPKKRKKLTKRKGSISPNMFEDHGHYRGETIIDLDEARMLKNRDLEAISQHRIDPQVSPVYREEQPHRTLSF